MLNDIQKHILEVVAAMKNGPVAKLRGRDSLGTGTKQLCSPPPSRSTALSYPAALTWMKLAFHTTEPSFGLSTV